MADIGKMAAEKCKKAIEGVRHIARWIVRIWKKQGYTVSVAGLILLLGAASFLLKTDTETVRDLRPRASAEPIRSAAVSMDEPLPQALQETPARAVFSPVWPLEGEVAGDFNSEAPAWSESLLQWQTHAGIDIAAPNGTAVFCAFDGTVKSTYKDVLFGNTVVVEHEGGYETVYASLGTVSLLAPGERIKAGDVLSAVGNTAICEADLGPHLHFEILKDGKAVSPAEYLSEREELSNS